MNEISGRAWKFHDNVDTDGIVPGRYLDAPMEEIVGHVLENLRPDFAGKAQKGDVIVAGKNFGCGSSRENAASALKALGIACVVAESFGRIFFRNAIAIGMPVIACPGASKIAEDGDTVSIRIPDAAVTNLLSGIVVHGARLSEDMIGILEAGGIMEYLKAKGGCTP